MMVDHAEEIQRAYNEGTEETTKTPKKKQKQPSVNGPAPEQCEQEARGVRFLPTQPDYSGQGLAPQDGSPEGHLSVASS